MRSGDVIGIAQYDDNPLIAADASNTATTVYVGYDPATGQIFTEQDVDALRLGKKVETVTIESVGGSGPLEVSLSAEVKPGMHFNRDCILLQNSLRFSQRQLNANANRKIHWNMF